MRSVYLKRFNCCIKKAVASSKIGLFNAPGELGLFLRNIGGIEPITQIGYLSNKSKFAFEDFHKEEVTAYLQNGMANKSLMRHLTPRQCLNLLNLFVTLDDANLHPEIDLLTNYIVDSMAQFTQEELNSLSTIYGFLHEKNLYFLDKQLTKTYHHSMNLKPYLQSIGVDNLIEKDILLSCDLNRRIIIKDLRDRVVLEVIFYDDRDIDGINVTKTRLFKDKVTYLHYFVDHSPFEHEGRIYNVLNNDTAVYYGEQLQKKGYRFDDKDALMMFRPGGKIPCAVNTFVAFLNLKNDLSVELVGRETIGSFNETALAYDKANLSSKIYTLKQLTQISLANHIVRDSSCPELTLTARQTKSQCNDALKAANNPLKPLIQSDLYQNLYEGKIDKACKQIVDSMRKITGSSSPVTSAKAKGNEPRFCAFIDSKYKSLFLYHIVKNLANRKNDASHAETKIKDASGNLDELNSEYLMLDLLITGDSLTVSEESGKWLDMQELFSAPTKKAGHMCSLGRLLMNAATPK